MKSSTKNLIVGSSFMFVGKIARIGLFFILYVVIGRFFGAEISGIFTLSFGVFQLLELIAHLGIYNTIVRYVPGFLHERDSQKISTLLSTSFKALLLVSITLASLGIIFSGLIAETFGQSDVRNYLIILLCALPLAALNKASIAFMTSHQDTKFEAIAENVVFPIVMISIVAIAVITNKPILLPVSITAAYLSTFILSSVALRRKGYSFSSLLTRKNKFESSYLYYSFPILVNTVLFYLIMKSDLYFLGIYEKVENVGIYNAALNIALLPTIFLTSINTIYFPTITKLLAIKDFDATKKLYTNVIRYLSFLTLPICSFSIVYGNELVSLFGKEFVVNRVLLSILIFGAFINIFTGPIGFTLNALDKQKVVTVNSLISLTLSVLLNVLLIPQYGLIGAAVANATAMSVQNILGMIEFYHYTNHQPYTLKQFYLLLVLLGSGIGLYYLQENFTLFSHFSGDLPLKVVQIGFIGIFYYLFCALFVLIFRLYEKEDMKLANDLLVKFGITRKLKS